MKNLIAIATLALLLLAEIISAQPVRRRDEITYSAGNKQTQNIGPVYLSTDIENDYYIHGQSIGHMYAEVRTTEKIHRNHEYRAPLNLSIVIDRSGSMAGEKLINAKKAAKHLIDELSSDDYVSVVIYDNSVSVLQPTTRVTNSNSIKNKISTITDGGGTNLMGGALRGYDEVKRSYKDGYINRVLLLSDGQANEGITNPRDIERIVGKQSRENGITISTFGLGHDYNEDLMTDMAETGNGNYYFIQNANDIVGIFDKELNGISNSIASNASLKIILPQGVSIKKVFGYRYTQNGNVITVHMNTLFTNETKGVLIRYEKNSGSTQGLQFSSSLSFNNDAKSGQQRITLYNTCNFTSNRRLYNSSFSEWVAAQITLYESNEQLEYAMREADKGNYEKARTMVKKNKEYMQSKAPLVQKSVELQKAESVNDSYDNSLLNIESMSSTEVKQIQKASKASNYGVRNKK